MDKATVLIFPEFFVTVQIYQRFTRLLNLLFYGRTRTRMDTAYIIALKLANETTVKNAKYLMLDIVSCNTHRGRILFEFALKFLFPCAVVSRKLKKKQVIELLPSKNIYKKIRIYLWFYYSKNGRNIQIF